MKAARLLTIPIEIRYQIYDQLVKDKLNLHAGVRFTKRYISAHDTPEEPVRNTVKQATGTTKVQYIPWVSLLQTCHAMYKEITAFMSSASFKRKYKSTTLDLDLSVSPCGKKLERVSVRNILCPPSRVSHIILHMRASDGNPTLWTVRQYRLDRIHPLAKGIWHTLNWLLHCGPRLNGTPLPDGGMKVVELNFRLRNGVAPRKGSWRAGTGLDDMRHAIHLCFLHAFISRHVFTLRLIYSERRTKHSVVETVDLFRPVHQSALPSWLYKRLRFRWGVKEPKRDRLLKALRDLAPHRVQSTAIKAVEAGETAGPLTRQVEKPSKRNAVTYIALRALVEAKALWSRMPGRKG